MNSLNLTPTELYCILALFVGIAFYLLVYRQPAPYIAFKEPLFSGYVVYKEIQVPATSIISVKRKDNYDHTTYMFRCWEDGPAWTPSLAKALHFVRREDADSFSGEDPEEVFIRPAINFKSYYFDWV